MNIGVRRFVECRDVHNTLFRQVIDDLVHKFDLISAKILSVQKLSECRFSRLSIQPYKSSDEQPKTSAIAFCLLNFLCAANPILQQDFF